MKTGLTFFWIATGIYGVSAFLYILSFIFKKERFIRYGSFLVGLGFLTQTVSLAWCWAEIGIQVSTLHTYELVIRLNGTTWAGVFIFLLAQLFTKQLKPAGILIMPITVLLLFWAGISFREIGTIPAVLTTWWFWVHMSSGGFAYAFVLIAGATGLLYLLKDKYKLQITPRPSRGGNDKFYENLPDLKVLDDLMYRFVALGFVTLTIMIISGSLWANQVHGRYWGWDPVEVQSLISWLVYAIWLHLRLTRGWRGRKLAWYSLFALIAIGINLTGVPFVEKVFHSGFRLPH